MTLVSDNDDARAEEASAHLAYPRPSAYHPWWGLWPPVTQPVVNHPSCMTSECWYEREGFLACKDHVTGSSCILNGTVTKSLPNVLLTQAKLLA